MPLGVAVTDGVADGLLVKVELGEPVPLVVADPEGVPDGDGVTVCVAVPDTDGVPLALGLPDVVSEAVLVRLADEVYDGVAVGDGEPDSL